MDTEYGCNILRSLYFCPKYKDINSWLFSQRLENQTSHVGHIVFLLVFPTYTSRVKLRIRAGVRFLFWWQNHARRRSPLLPAIYVTQAHRWNVTSQ